MRVSGCIIVKNEERNIATCIKSFQAVANEIIVIDTGSTDRTVEIAKNLNAIVYHYEWDNNFAETKNFALDKAHGEWVIFLDADEFFFNDTAKNIPKIVRKIRNTNIDGLLCKMYHMEDEQTIKASDFIVRVFRNNPQIRFEGSIHEVIKKSGRNLKLLKLPETELVLYHTGYGANVVKSKAERNLEIILENQKHGKESKMSYYHLSDCYFVLGEFDLTIENSRKFIESDVQLISHNVRPYTNLINAMIRKGSDYKDILKEIKVAMQKYPDHPDFWWLLGLTHFLNFRYNKALEAYEKCLQLTDSYDGTEICFASSFHNMIYFHVGLIFTAKNNYVHAMECFLKSLDLNKFSKDAFRELIKTVKNENPEDIILLLKSIYDVNAEEDVYFLVENLASFKLGSVLLYFSKLCNNKYGHEDSYFIFAMLANGMYKEVFEYFSHCHLMDPQESTALFTVISGMLSENWEGLNNIKDNLRLSLVKIVNLYQGVDDDTLSTTTDLEDYKQMLREFTLCGTEKGLVKLINIKNYFDANISIVIGDIFAEYMAYDLALGQYADALDLAEKPDVGDLFFKIAFCLYKLRNFKDAISAFKEALRYGYDEDIISEYLNWLADQCGENMIKSEVTSFRPD